MIVLRARANRNKCSSRYTLPRGRGGARGAQRGSVARSAGGGRARARRSAAQRNVGPAKARGAGRAPASPRRFPQSVRPTDQRANAPQAHGVRGWGQARSCRADGPVANAKTGNRRWHPDRSALDQRRIAPTGFWFRESLARLLLWANSSRPGLDGDGWWRGGAGVLRPERPFGGTRPRSQPPDGVQGSQILRLASTPRAVALTRAASRQIPAGSAQLPDRLDFGRVCG